MIDKTEIQTALAAFKEKRDKLNMLIAELEAMVGTTSDINEAIDSEGVSDKSETPDSQVSNAGLRSDLFFRMSIPAAAKKYLGIIKHPAETKEITKALKEGGILTQAKNFNVNVHSAMSRDHAFIRVKKKWALAEWYPSKFKSISTSRMVTKKRHTKNKDF